MGKLLKHDLKSTYKLALMVYIVSIIITAVTAVITLIFQYFTNDIQPDNALGFLAFAFIVFLPVYAGVFIALSSMPLIIEIMVAYNYYKTLFTDEGYLTFTLPVSAKKILDSKIIIGILYIAAAYILIGVEYFIISLFFSYGSSYADNVSFFSSIFSVLSASNSLPLMVESVIVFIFSSVSALFTLYLAVTIGSQITKKYKIPASVGIYVLINFLISGISSVIPGILYLTESDLAMHLSNIISILLYAVVAVAAYLINLHFLKKVNLT